MLSGAPCHRTHASRGRVVSELTLSFRFRSLATHGSYLTVLNDSTMDRRKEILPAGRGMKDVQVLILTPSTLSALVCGARHDAACAFGSSR